jgi:excisionase family DNA binding protein
VARREIVSPLSGLCGSAGSGEATRSNEATRGTDSPAWEWPGVEGVAPKVGAKGIRTMKKRIKAEPAPIGEKLLTLRDAAGVLRMNPRTLRAYLRRGEIEGRVTGGKYRFRRIALDRFFEDAPRQWDFKGNDDRED